MNRSARNVSPQRRNVTTLNQLAADKYIMGGKVFGGAKKKRASSKSPKKVTKSAASKPAKKARKTSA